MNKIIWYALLIIFSQSNAMDNNQNEPTDFDHYETFLYYTWGPKLYDFHVQNSHDPYAQKLERFKNNYLFAAILYKHLKNCTAEEAARLAYRKTPIGSLALHNVLYGTIDDFNEDNYRGVKLKSRWRNELEHIEQQIR